MSTLLVALVILLKSVCLSSFVLLVNYLGSLIDLWKFDFDIFWFALGICILWDVIKLIRYHRRNKKFSVLVGNNPAKARSFFEKYDEHIIFSDDPTYLNALCEGNMYLYIINERTTYFKFSNNNHKEEFYINIFINQVK